MCMCKEDHQDTLCENGKCWCVDRPSNGFNTFLMMQHGHHVPHYYDHHGHANEVNQMYGQQPQQQTPYQGYGSPQYGQQQPQIGQTQRPYGSTQQ